VTSAHLAEELLLTFARGSSLRRLTNTAFRQAQITPRRLIGTQAVGSAAGMVAIGLGVYVATDHMLLAMSFVKLVTGPVRAPALPGPRAPL
jgi:hypothetical protein